MDLSSKAFCGIHLRAISPQEFMNLIKRSTSEIVSSIASNGTNCAETFSFDLQCATAQKYIDYTIIMEWMNKFRSN